MKNRMHLVIDFMFLYYKYKNTLNIGKLKRLSFTKPDDSHEEADITLVYYPLREIESLRKKYESEGNEVYVSVCFDSPSDRSDEDSDYKKTRKKSLCDADFDTIAVIKELLEKAGHNVYKVDGKEADDLVYTLVEDTKDQFDETIIFTTDYDLLVNVQEKVKYRKYKMGHGFETAVSVDSFAEYVRNHNMCDTLKYNGILVYKCILGDKSDNVSGVKGIGKAKFDSLVNKCIALKIIGTDTSEKAQFIWSEFRNPEKVNELLVTMRDMSILTESQFEQAQHSLKLVTPKYIEGLKRPDRLSTQEERSKAYSLYGMTSLI